MHLHRRNHSLKCPPELAQVDTTTYAKPRPAHILLCSIRLSTKWLQAFGSFTCAGVTLVAYSVSRIVTEQTDEHSDRLLFYGEPTPESIGPLVRIHRLH